MGASSASWATWRAARWRTSSSRRTPTLLTYAGEIREQRLHVLPPPKTILVEGDHGAKKLLVHDTNPGEAIEVLEAQAVAGRVDRRRGRVHAGGDPGGAAVQGRGGLWHISDVDAARMLRAFRQGPG
ncbi:MAG: hypothetical protein M5R40_24255 [Anaerolineae bacterium]|nr:hypothetical protein [Anaerolineae bacterium]